MTELSHAEVLAYLAEHPDASVEVVEAPAPEPAMEASSSGFAKAELEVWRLRDVSCGFCRKPTKAMLPETAKSSIGICRSCLETYE